MIMNTGYTDGYKDGYTWLTRGKNFLHPSAPKGYIPGGPSAIFYNYEYRKAWHEGWIAGINAYVKDNALDYPAV